MTQITHCIFDMDGLLLDTERVYTEVTQEILDKYGNGQKFTWDVKSKLMGRSAPDSAALTLDIYKLPLTVDEYLKLSLDLQEHLFPLAKLLPGVERLLRHLHANKIPIAVATSSSKQKFDLKTSLHKPLFELFDVIVCGDDPEVKHAKPSPDLFLTAQKRLGNPPSDNCLVFEDAVNGIQAGLAANMSVVWIPDENIKQLTGEEVHGSKIVLNSMADFDPSAFGLPPF